MKPAQLIVTAPAKLNLSFDIIGKDTNDYHQLITLFQAIDLEDKLTFAIAPDKENTVLLSLASTSAQSTLLPLDDSNLINKAIKLFLSRLFQSVPVKIIVTIEKNIPIGAGLAGGSSNAAATLLALNHYFSNPFVDTSLMEMAAQLGSDVAFCLCGGLAIGRGYGEKLQKMQSVLPGHFVLIKPKSISISTAWAYNIYDQSVAFSYTSQDQAEAKLKTLIRQISNQAPYSIPEGNNIPDLLWNCFEPIIFKEFPILAQIKQSLLHLGCPEAHLTGSGPTIYALVKNKEHGQEVLKNILAMDWSNLNNQSSHEPGQPGIMIQGWLTKSVGHGVRVLREESYEGQAKQETIASS